jgi:hypothetical protein
MNSQRQNTRTPDPSVLVKIATVFPKGGVHEPEVPADVPLFEQIVDSTGAVLRTSSNGFAHVAGMNYERIGGGTKCVGCHAGHSVLTVPMNGALAEWFNAAPSAKATGSSFFVNEHGRTFVPQRVVDRQARTGGDSVIWVSNEGEGGSVSLTWDNPMEIREIVLYGISPDPGAGTTIRVQDSEILLYYRSSEVGRISSTGRIRPEGTHVSLPVTRVDSARVVITKFFGTVFHRRIVGLAEVETIARIH